MQVENYQNVYWCMLDSIHTLHGYKIIIHEIQIKQSYCIVFEFDNQIYHTRFYPPDTTNDFVYVEYYILPYNDKKTVFSHYHYFQMFLGSLGEYKDYIDSQIQENV